MLITVELTEQEQSALAALAHGRRIRDLMPLLSLSEASTYRLLRDARSRLGAVTNVEAVAIAITNELIEYEKFTL